MEVKDSNGNVLNAGDAAIITKSLKVKGLPKPIKKGTKVKNIRLTDNDREIEAKVEGTLMVIKTEFLKKA